MIIVYDVDVKRISHVHNYLRENLHWVQNSVFEGDVRLSQFARIKDELRKMTKENDCVIIYTFRTSKHIRRIIIGKEKNEMKNII